MKFLKDTKFKFFQNYFIPNLLMVNNNILLLVLLIMTQLSTLFAFEYEFSVLKSHCNGYETYK